MKYHNFTDWWDEIENYGTRGDRLVETYEHNLPGLAQVTWGIASNNVLSVHQELLDAIDDVCDWLDYEFSPAEIAPAVKRLNGARMRHLAAQQRAKRLCQDEPGKGAKSLSRWLASRLGALRNLGKK